MVSNKYFREVLTVLSTKMSRRNVSSLYKELATVENTADLAVSYVPLMYVNAHLLASHKQVFSEAMVLAMDNWYVLHKPRG